MEGKPVKISNLGEAQEVLAVARSQISPHVEGYKPVVGIKFELVGELAEIERFLGFFDFFLATFEHVKLLQSFA